MERPSSGAAAVAAAAALLLLLTAAAAAAAAAGPALLPPNVDPPDGAVRVDARRLSDDAGDDRRRPLASLTRLLDAARLEATPRLVQLNRSGFFRGREYCRSVQSLTVSHR